MATKQQLPAAGQEFDPKYEWQENANSFVLRLHLSGFRKDDFRVQVDGAGRLTVRGQRTDGGAKHARFHKVFQLPATSNLDDISGRFDAGVLTLTVPKRPATVEPINKPTKEAADDAKPKAAVDAGAKPKEETKKQAETKPPPKNEARKAEQHKEEIKKPKDDAKPKEDARKKPDGQQVKEAAQAKIRSKPEQEQEKTAPPAAVRKEEEKPKAADEAAATEKKQAKPPQADGERAATKQAVDHESLAEKVRCRVEEERTKAAAAAEEETERERKTTACGRWKERVAEELEGLPVTEWAEGLVETVKKNREVIAAAVAAFSLGLFVSSRLFSRN